MVNQEVFVEVIKLLRYLFSCFLKNKGSLEELSALHLPIPAEASTYVAFSRCSVTIGKFDGIFYSKRYR